MSLAELEELVLGVEVKSKRGVLSIGRASSGGQGAWAPFPIWDAAQAVSSGRTFRSWEKEVASKGITTVAL